MGGCIEMKIKEKFIKPMIITTLRETLVNYYYYYILENRVDFFLGKFELNPTIENLEEFFGEDKNIIYFLAEMISESETNTKLEIESIIQGELEDIKKTIQNTEHGGFGLNNFKSKGYKIMEDWFKTRFKDIPPKDPTVTPEGVIKSFLDEYKTKVNDYRKEQTNKFDEYLNNITLESQVNNKYNGEISLEIMKTKIKERLKFLTETILKAT